ncbi:MAG: dTDP-4-dehydrorhamnose reductase [Chloroflexota bacterium]|nr:dTDP-4-dehydrorhamnose reductase [Chloroflexota bacterium]
MSDQSPVSMPAGADDLTGLRVMVTGAGGQVGAYLLDSLRTRSAEPIGIGTRPGPGVVQVVDIRDAAAVRRAMVNHAPDAVIHAAAYTDVDGCERDPERAHAVNALGAAHVAAACAATGAYLIGIGTDFVFPGDGGAPYAEDAEPRPLSVYGASKLAGERAILAADPAFTVARTAWVWGGPGKHFPRTVLAVLAKRETMAVVTDETGNPTHAAHLAAALVELLARRGAGIFHLVNGGQASRYALARAVASAAGLDPDRIRPTTAREFALAYPLPAKRPADSRLDNARAAGLRIRLPYWGDAVRDAVPDLASSIT